MRVGLTKSCLAAVSIALSISLLQPVQCADSDLKTAYALSTAGKYAEAAALFQKAIAGPAKSNALAYYYLASCEMQLGKQREARAHFKTCLALNPPATIASYCHRALGTSPDATASATTAASTTSTTTTSTPSKPAAGNYKTRGLAAMSAAPKATLDPLDKDFVTIHRRTPETDQIYNTVVGAISMIPKDIKEDIKGGGCKILICPTILDANPHLREEKPSGYNHGGAYDNCPGMFYSGTKILYVAEKFSWKNSPPALNWMAASTTLHELGHAYDFAKGNITSGGEFEKLYKQDYERISNSNRTKWDYYCQDNGGERGRAELFAELFALSHGTAGGIDRGSSGLIDVFPHCYTFVKNLGK